jgi:lysophospholipase L1-like esterase
LKNVEEDQEASARSSGGHEPTKGSRKTDEKLFSRPKARRVGRILLVAAGLLVGLVLAELGLRVVGYEGDHERKNTVYHDDYGQLLKNAWVFDAVFDPSRSDHVEINGKNVAFEKTAGQTRVVFVGDSGTFGSGVKRNEAFPIVFGTLAKFLGVHELEVVNAAVPGMSNVTEYRLLEGQLTTLQPDIVVLGLFMANDINWNLDDEHLLGEARSRWRTFGRRLRERSALAHFAALQLLVLSSKSTLGEAPNEPLTELPRWDRVNDAGLHMFNYTQGEIATYRKRYSPLMEYAFDLLREILWRCKRLGEKEGFQFAVVLIPTSSQISDELQIFTAPEALEEIRESGIEIEEDELDVEKPLRVVRDICRELDIVCIDPTVDLRRIGARRVIPDEDDHLNRDGHRVLAVSLATRYDHQTRRFVH